MEGHGDHAKCFRPCCLRHTLLKGATAQPSPACCAPSQRLPMPCPSSPPPPFPTPNVPDEQGPSDMEIAKLPHWDRRHTQHGGSEGKASGPRFSPQPTVLVCMPTPVYVSGEQRILISLQGWPQCNPAKRA